MKKVAMITLVSTAALLLFVPSADAAPKNDNTDVGVNFKSDEPTIPGEHKPYKDNLAIVWKPSTFHFGEQKAVAGVATFNNTVQGNQYLIVNDDRKAEALSPWALTVQLTKLETADKGKDLPSKLTFTLGDPQSYDIGDTVGSDNDYIPNKPDDAGVLGDLDPNSGITLGDGTTKEISLEAGNSTGKMVFEKKTAGDKKVGVSTLITGAKLVVADAEKAKASGESFTGQVIWTLDDLKP